MANEVYLITHDNLSNIVSARAASRVLDKALKSKGHTISTVTKEQMHEVLVGPVFKELELILPSDGVKRTIQHITRILAEEASDESTKRSQDATPFEQSNLIPVEQSPEESDNLDSLISDLPVDEANPTVTQTQAPFQLLENKAPTAIKVDFSLEDVEAGLLAFAQLEHIQTVLSVKTENGEVVSSRGSGFDLSSLSRLANMSLKLLEHRGAVRSYHLDHRRHHLFLIPLGQYLMIVVGANQLNVGEVFSKVTTMRASL